MKSNYFLKLGGKLSILLGLLFLSFENRAQLSTQIFSYTGTIQTFTVPPCVTSITVDARGASGGDNVTLTNMGGKGAQIIGTFTTTPGSVINIVVGQKGYDNTGGNVANGAGGGGGGSFVWLSTATTPMIVAGGGGASCLLNNGLPNYLGKDASISTSGTGSRSDDVYNNSPGGTNGANGTSVCGSGGKGWIAVLANPAGNPAGNATYGAAGGYGGGGGGGTTPNIGNYLHTGGGGGGYSGGGAGGTDYYHGGGGGGSFNAGTNQVNTGTVQTGNGVVHISYNPGTPVTIVATPTAICNGSSATLIASGVSTYTWLNNSVVSNSIIVNPSSTTAYTVVGTNSVGCTQAVVKTITVTGTVPVLSISNPSTTICLGQSVTLTGSGALTYSWTNGVINGQAFYPSATTVYTVIGGNGCGLTTGTTAITVAPLAVNVLASPSLVCQGYPSTLTAVSSVTGYTWQPGNLVSATPIISPTVSGVYTVTASDGICNGTATLQVLTKTTPTISATASSTLVCEKDVVTLTASGAGTGGTYTWTPTGSNASSFTVSPLMATAYVVAGTNTNNCEAQTQVVVVTQPLPIVNIVASKTLVCSGQSLTMTATGGTNYVWSGGPSTAGYTVSPPAYGVYTVTATHTLNLVCTASKTIALAAITPSVAYTSSLSVCSGQSATLTASGANTYSWNGTSAPSGQRVVTPLTTTTYTLLANTQSLTTICPSTNTAIVVVNPNPTVTAVVTKTNTVCKGVTNTITAQGATNYSWTGTVNGTGNKVTVNPNITTSYTVTGTDAAGCTGTAVVQAKVTGCNGISEYEGGLSLVSIYPNPNNGDFQVSAKSDLELRIINSLGQDVRNLKLDAAGDYKVQVKDLSNGIYFLVGKNEMGEILQIKIIVGK